MRVSDIRLGLGLQPKIRRVLRPLRLTTSKMRPLPDFIIIGAQKAGTSTLFRTLLEHPCIRLSDTKEIHYFDLNYQKGEAWYRSHFPIRNVFDTKIQYGEASPYYLFHPSVPKRIASLIPNAKLIVLLRNPVTRAYSNFQHECRLGHEDNSFRDALRLEESRLDGEHQRLVSDESYVSKAHQFFAYRTRGIYIEQLRRYAQYFGRDRILAIKSEDFWQDPTTVWRETLDFLNLDFSPLKSVKARNVGSYDAAIPDDLIQELEDFYQPYNEQLSDWYGKDFCW